VSQQSTLGRILVEKGVITEAELNAALQAQQETGKLLGEVLVENEVCTVEDVLMALSEQLHIPYVRLTERMVENDAVARLPADLAYRHQALPLTMNNGRIRVAVGDPFNFAAIDDIRIATGLFVEPVLASPSEIRRLVEKHYMQRMIEETHGGGEEIEVLQEDETEIGDLQRMAKEAVVIQWVNMVLRQAIQDRASDIHIEPFERGWRVRFRIDGVLHEVPAPPKRLQAAVVSRIKIMGNMDIAERRLPQDGRIKLRVSGKEVDLRVSTVPTLFGESVVMRILEKTSVLFGMEELGMLPETMEKFRRTIRIPHGIILVTGPTGSGKTTTLYAALRETYSVEKKIITIEDPVEYQLDGVNQIHVRPKIGLTFANGLRSILRQDPDIIMVGEIRDAETAEIAIHAALTGHLVFSTIHTNDAAGAITRLIDMGIEPFLVASSMEAVLAQRLVRRVCNSCAQPEPSKPLMSAGQGLPVPSNRRRGKGCEDCKFTGYRGRTGIFELLLLDEDIRTMIVNRATAGEIADAAIKRGMKTMLRDGMEKVEMGLTTIEEVTRVTREDERVLQGVEV
jgi:type II secretion system protein E